MPVEDFGAYGMEWMDEAEIGSFLAEQRVGVLSIPAGEQPVLRPMSFAFDPPSRLYFLYVLTEGSRKEAATAGADGADGARFLTYEADARFDWTSVLLAGEIDAVPEGERDAVEAEIDLGWRPEAFEQASGAATTRLYAFEIAERSGLKQRGPPPGYEPQL